jgi:hypothetical protein
MIQFLIIFVLVLVAVDLLVRFVIDPMIKASRNKAKLEKAPSPRFDPTLKLATETMFDGGKPHPDGQTYSAGKDEIKNEDSAG